MLMIAIWHASVSEATAFANDCDLASELVTLVQDSEMRHSFWGFYRVSNDRYRSLTAMPRLTWK